MDRSTTSTGRSNRGRVLMSVATACVLAVGTVACSSGRTTLQGSDTTVSTSISPTTTAPPETTVAPTTTVVETTVAATTTTIATTTTTTEAPTTVPAVTVPTVPAGWVAADFPDDAFLPLDESNFIGVPSPTLPADASQPLTDGVYSVHATTPWTAADPGTLHVTVERLEACTVLPENACISFGDPFGATEMGIDDSTSLELAVPLDDTLAVGVGGFDCDLSTKTGNGADLAALFSAYDAAYSAVVLPQLQQGGDNESIMADLTATPRQGFEPLDSSCNFGGGILFRSGDAPPLLLQVVVDYEGTGVADTPLLATDLIRLNTAVVQNGHLTLYFYAGFYS